MKLIAVLSLLIGVCFFIELKNEIAPLDGTWELQTGMIIKNNDTIVTNYTKGQRLVKIINKSHFSFLRHDLNKGKDSSAVFVAGGGSYSYDGTTYKEYLEFCTSRSWEGNEFSFQVEIQNDTLIQTGLEKNDEIGVNQEIIETYVRIKKLNYN